MKRVGYLLVIMNLAFATLAVAEGNCESSWGPDSRIQEESSPAESAPMPAPRTPVPGAETPASAVETPGAYICEYEQEWEDVEYDIFDEIIPFEKRIALLKKFMAAHPGDHPHKKEAEYYLPLLEQHMEPRNHPFDKKRVPESKMLTPVSEPYDPSRTEWVGLRVMGGSWGMGAMTSFFTRRYSFLYWSVLQTGMVYYPNRILMFLFGTKLGLQFQLDRENIHEIRVGTGLIGIFGIGLKRISEEDPPGYGFMGSFIDAEFSYLYRIHHHFAIEAGLDFLLPTYKVNAKDFLLIFTGTIGFVGVRF